MVLLLGLSLLALQHGGAFDLIQTSWYVTGQSCGSIEDSAIFTKANHDYFSIPHLFYQKYAIKENQPKYSINQVLSWQLVQTRNANMF